MAGVAGDGPQVRRTPLKRLLGWPARRLLDPRALWTANLVAETVDDRVDVLLRRVADAEARLAEQGHGLHAKLAVLRVDELVARGPGTLAELSHELGRLLNWAEGHEGYAAQAGVWFNPPVALDHQPGHVAPRHVNERIVEPPFVFAALAGLDPPARVLDVGGSESTVGLSLAALGHDVTVVDPRGYPIAHPRLRSLACRLDELDPDLSGFDAAVAVSAVEHFGLGGYGAADAFGGRGGGGGGRLDLAALEDLRRRRLRPGGILALTVPYGEPRVDDFERVYDAAGLAELLDGWQVDRARAAWHVDPLTWVAGELDVPLARRGVALVVARAPAG